MSVLSDRDIKNVIDKDIVIYPIGEECISPIGYDLRIGYAINLVNQDSSSERNLNFKNNDKFEIPAKTSTLIITKEYVYLSKKIAGTLHARGSLAAKGIFMNSTTIDPNWDGQLTFLIYNNNDKPIELDAESRFVTLIFHQVNTPTTSTPTTNPISVAREYGDIYGEIFNKSMVEYLLSSDNHLLKKDFDKLVQVSKKPELYDVICDTIKEISVTIKSFIHQRLSQLVAKIIIIISVILIFIGLTLQFYWDKLSSWLNLDIPYALNIIMPQIAVLGIGFTSFIGLMNFIKTSK